MIRAYPLTPRKYASGLRKADSSSNGWYAYHTSTHDIREPALCLVNRQLRNDTLPMFYGNNTFEFDFNEPIPPRSPRSLDRCLNGISAESSRWIRRLVFRHTVVQYNVIFISTYFTDAYSENHAATTTLSLLEDGSVHVDTDYVVPVPDVQCSCERDLDDYLRQAIVPFYGRGGVESSPPSLVQAEGLEGVFRNELVEAALAF